MDMFLWQHVSRPRVWGGARRGGQRENTLFFFSLLLVWSVLLFSVLLLP